MIKDIFSQLNLNDNEKYIFATLSGTKIPRNLDLAAFGVGSVLSSWELNILEHEGVVSSPAPVVLQSRDGEESGSEFF